MLAELLITRNGCPSGQPFLIVLYPQRISLNLYEVLPVFKGTSACYTSDNKCISAFLFFIRIFYRTFLLLFTL